MNINIKKITNFRYLFNAFTTFVIIVIILFSSEAKAYWDKVTNIPAPYNNTRAWLEFWFLEEDNNYGWLCGFDGKVIRTTDKGKTWQGSIVPGADQLESITFTDKLNGYVSGISIWGYGAIYKSVDGGVTWREVTDSRRSGNLWGNHFLDKDNGIVVGGGCRGLPLQFFRTTNGGISWYLAQYQEWNSGLSDVFLLNNGQGFAASSGLIWRTTNSGYDWTKLSNSGGLDWQEDLHINGQTILVPYSDDCEGVLDNGGIRISKDFGNSWSDFDTKNSMFGAWLIDEMQGWACGHSASCYYTSNVGDSWELRNCGLDPDEVLDDFWFFDDTTGFVCGRNVYRYAVPKRIETKILSSSQTACEGDTVVLAADGSYFHYEWSTGSTDSSIIVTKSGIYELAAYNSICDTIVPASIRVDFFPKPDLLLKMDGDTVICEGDSLKLWAETNGDRITWSNGSTSDTLIVNESGTYQVRSENEYGCWIEDEVTIRVSPLPEPELTLKGRQTFCAGDSTIIEATPGYSSYKWYDSNGNEWVTSENRIKVGSSGKYYCVAVNNDDCEGGGKDTVEIIVIDDVNRIVFSFPEKKEFDMDSTYFPNMICKTMQINNATQKDYVIDLPYLYRNESFSFPLSQFPLLLRGDDSVQLKVCYSPTQLGFERDSVLINDVCNPHYLVLKGLSLANRYSSSSICNAPVIGITNELPGKVSISTTEPYPNPAANIISVPFNERKPQGYDENAAAEIFNVFGERIMTAEKRVSNMYESNNMINIIGEFTFNTEDIKTGSYIIIVRSADIIKRYNISIIK